MHSNTQALLKKVNAVLILANICVLTLYVGGWSYSTPSSHGAQVSGRKITRDLPETNEPIEIGDIRFKGKALKFEEEFEGVEETWIKDITVKVKNVSKKPITYFRLDLIFPETRATGEVVTQHLFIGQRSDIASTTNNQLLLLMPNQSIDVPLAPHFDKIKSLIESRQLQTGSINQISVRLGDAMFEDGTLYSGGAIFRRNPDPNSTRKWLIIRDEQPSPSSK